jgi:surface antigen
VAVVGGVVRLVYASEQQRTEVTSAVTVSKTFETADRGAVLRDETINITSSTDAQWTMGLLATAFGNDSRAVRNSQVGISSSEWGIGQWTRLAPGNTYVSGQCTWYAYNRRYQMGRPIGGYWGNGGYWHYSASNSGFLVNHLPEVGAIFEQAGHVAIVEEVGLDNSVRVSEMNYNYIPYNYNERWITNANQYWYIH